MHGIVSLLPSPFYEKVEEIWKRLEKESGISGIKVTPYPHFSWQIANNYDFIKLEKIMKEVAYGSKPFMVHTAGLGIFTGEKPIVFIPVIKTKQLIDFQSKIWELTQNIVHEVCEFYNPSHWMPHISLAYEDVNEKNLCKAIKELSFKTYNWSFYVNNLSLICEANGDIGDLKLNFPFMG